MGMRGMTLLGLDLFMNLKRTFCIEFFILCCVYSSHEKSFFLKKIVCLILTANVLILSEFWQHYGTENSAPIVDAINNAIVH